MAGDERNREIKVANFIQTDLLQKFISRNNIPGKLENKIPIEEDEEEEEEIELSLGLSLNGRFGVDPERAKEIVRASSISNFMIISGEKDSKSWSPYDAALTRTCSLPTETEEEWRKRKELQSLRRMEVKRKRSEKLKNVRVVRERVDLERNWQENGNGEIVIPPIKGDGVVELIGEITPPQFSSQGSIGSQGSGGSSGVSDLESQPIGGTSKYTEERSPVSALSPIEQTGQKTDKPLEAVVENPPPKIVVVGQEVKEAMKKNMMADMPCVSTRGDGPNGKRIEGFLYRYRNGEEVKIVCVCHGDATEFSWICISLAIGSNLLNSTVYWSACYHQQQLSIVRWFFSNHTRSKPSKDCFWHGGWTIMRFLHFMAVTCSFYISIPAPTSLWSFRSCDLLTKQTGPISQFNAPFGHHIYTGINQLLVSILGHDLQFGTRSDYTIQYSIWSSYLQSCS